MRKLLTFGANPFYTKPQEDNVTKITSAMPGGGEGKYQQQFDLKEILLVLNRWGTGLSG